MPRKETKDRNIILKVPKLRKYLKSAGEGILTRFFVIQSSLSLEQRW